MFIDEYSHKRLRNTHLEQIGSFLIVSYQVVF